MKSMSRRGIAAVALAAGVLFFAGCGDDKSKPKTGATDKNQDGVTDAGGPHSGWWCKEHGVPEEMCSLCSAKYAQQCKDKGDWCEEHDVAKSHCFKCDPTLQEKFAAMYRAKYPGKEPPPMED
jgi:hypothetical protein